jgi:chromosome segregation ATPase
VSRAALYRTYGPLKDEFTRRLAQMQANGNLLDPRAAQIVRLQDENARLRKRLGTCEHQIAELTQFRTTAISRLAAQHDEIGTLRQALASLSNVRALATVATTNHKV